MVCELYLNNNNNKNPEKDQRSNVFFKIPQRRVIYFVESLGSMHDLLATMEEWLWKLELTYLWLPSCCFRAPALAGWLKPQFTLG